MAFRGAFLRMRTQLQPGHCISIANRLYDSNIVRLEVSEIFDTQDVRLVAVDAIENNAAVNWMDVETEVLPTGRTKNLSDLLCVESAPPTGKIKLSDWLMENADGIGTHYQSELARRRDRGSKYEDL